MDPLHTCCPLPASYACVRWLLCDADAPEISFFGPVPGKESQYDIEVGWAPGEFFGGVNLTVACNATNDLGQPVAAIQQLYFAVVPMPQLR